MYKNSIEALRNLGTVLAGDRSIYWKLTVRENLEYFGALYGLNKKEELKRADEILEKLGLVNKADELLEKYSTGMKQKVALEKALMPNAPIVLLDEPTLGLDPQSALNLREIILDIKNEGRTVLLTTHYMEEADFLSDRIVIMDGGKIIALDTPGNLKSRLKDAKSIKLELNLNGKFPGFEKYAGNSDYMGLVILGFMVSTYVWTVSWSRGFALKEEMTQGVLESNWSAHVSRIGLLISKSASKMGIIYIFNDTINLYV